MSNDAIRWAFGLDLPSTRKFVLVALADHANDADLAFPGIVKLMAKTSLKERTVQASLSDLEADGIISTTSRRGGRASASDGKATTYRLNRSAKGASDCKGADGDGQGCSSLQARVQMATRKGADDCVHIDNPQALTLKNNPQEEPSSVPPLRVAIEDDQTNLFPVNQPSTGGVQSSAAPSQQPPPPAQAEQPPKRPPGRAAALAKSDPTDEAVATWNRLCGSRLATVATISNQRRRVFAARFRDSLGGSLATWEIVCRVIVADEFMTGGGDRGWTADFDWVLRPGRITRVLESQSAKRSPPRPVAGGAMARQADALADNLTFLASVAAGEPNPRFKPAGDQFAGTTIDGDLTYAE
jgi:hypothetical protein